MLKIAICDDSRTDVEMLECAFDKLHQYPIEQNRCAMACQGCGAVLFYR